MIGRAAPLIPGKTLLVQVFGWHFCTVRSLIFHSLSLMFAVKGLGKLEYIILNGEILLDASIPSMGESTLRFCVKF
jgi:hypothetical protein